MCLMCNPAAATLMNITRRNLLKGMGAAGLAAAMPFRAESASADPGEIIFFGGPILTMEADQPEVEAVAVADGVIRAVGSKDKLLAQKSANAQLVDLRGRTLLPGFIEPHMHTIFAYFEDWIDMGPFVNSSFDEAIGRLRAAAKLAKPGEWVRGWQYDPAITPGAQPIGMELLDDIAPDNPLFILEGNGHVTYANSRAFELAGITQDTANPPEGRYLHDAVGKLSGRMEEYPAFVPFVDKMPPVAPPEMERRVRALFDRGASNGCTAMMDCGLGLLMGEQDVRTIQGVVANDAPVRVRGALASTMYDKWVELGFTPGHGDDLFRLNAMKAWVDGSNQARTGYMREPYMNSSGRGELNYPLDKLKSTLTRAHKDGWQICVHANGDAGIDNALEAYAAALEAAPRADHRHRIEHCSIMHDEQIQKIGDLALSPSFLIGHVEYWGEAFRDVILGPERANLLDRCGSALKANLKISLHSDYNVTPIKPLQHIQTAVTRVMRTNGEILNPDERISVEAAIRAVTIDAAWQCHMDELTGSIKAGKAADFVILEDNPMTVAPDQISQIKVSETWLDGKRRFSANP
ncbi:twin-arginine translocation pathway signal protein [Brucella anthropi]|uniref:amidohydrolase n=1 Tax=Brucella anthropi TaxID=529 RepID=UPI003986C5DD